jgi:hypothetical protein
MRLPLIGALLCLCLCCVRGTAQVIADQARAAPIVSRFDPKPTDHGLSCSLDPVKPTLSFGFRFRAGYQFHVDLEQYTGARHRWTVLTEITPDGTGRPVHMVDVLRLPADPSHKMSGEAGGGYLLGEGHYRVRWILVDDLGRVCRKQWQIDVKLHRSESSAKVAMPPNSVAELSLRGLSTTDRHPDPGKPIKLTVLVDAAPLFQRRLVRNKLSANDNVFLVSAVSALLERIPTSSVRVVVFNLEHQNELFRRDGFTLDALGDVSRAMNDLRLATVDFKILQDRTGHVKFLCDLINQELRATPSSDAVIFLGPRERFDDKVPPELLELTRTPAPHFFFLKYRSAQSIRAAMRPDPCDSLPRADSHADPQVAGPHRGNPCMAPPIASTPNGDASFSADTVSLAVKILKGRTITIQSPGEFARAIEQIERRVATVGQPAQSPYFF